MLLPGERVSFFPATDSRNEFGYSIAAVILKTDAGKVLIGMMHKITGNSEWEAIRRWVDPRKLTPRQSTKREVDSYPWV